MFLTQQQQYQESNQGFERQPETPSRAPTPLIQLPPPEPLDTNVMVPEPKNVIIKERIFGPPGFAGDVS